MRDAHRLPCCFAALVAAALAARAEAQTVSPRLLFDVDGTAPSAAVGQCVASIGDLNGDGTPDFAIGIPNYGPISSDSTGRVLVFFGAAVPGATPDLILEGPARGSRFGAEIQPLGDVNGDGFDDLLVTAPRYAYTGINRTGSGRAYVYLGGNVPAAVPALTIDSPMPYGSLRSTGFGIRACGIGDMDGDGYGDFAVVAESGINGNGDIYVYRGGRPPASTVFLDIGNPGYGRLSVCGPGDLNGDGYADLVLASTDVYTTRWPNCELDVAFSLRQQSLQLTTVFRTSVPGFGTTLVAAGDLNGDHVGDVLIGNPRAAGGGAAFYMLSSFAIGSLLPPSPAPDSFGTALAAGDVDGDGKREILVGAPATRLGGVGAGAVYLYRYPPTAPIGVWTGSAGDGFGYSIAVPGDLDRNGAAEFVVGSPRRGSSPSGAGRAQLLTATPQALAEPIGAAEWRAGRSARVRWRGTALARVSLSLDDGATWRTLADNAGGQDANELTIAVPDTATGRGRLRVSPAGTSGGTALVNTCPVQIVRDSPGFAAVPVDAESWAAAPGARRFGSAIDAGRDLDRDGWPDAVLGAPGAGGGVSTTGEARVLFGGPGPHAERRLVGERVGDEFGASVSMSGDVDKDGRADLLIGAPGNDAAGAECGRAYLYLGGVTVPPALVVQGDQPGEEFGSTVLLIPDINGDGYSDWAVASPSYQPSSTTKGVGRVRVYLGGPIPSASAALVIDAPLGVAGFGATMAAVDLNRDGRSDLAISAFSVNGATDRVFIYNGAPTRTLHAYPDVTLRGERLGDGFGSSMASAGDPNGDGFEDLLVGAPQARNANGGEGRVYLFTGAYSPGMPPTHIFEGAATDVGFGSALARAGDLNRDGREDFVIGATGGAGITPHAGVVRAYYGSSDDLPDLEWPGPAENSWFGAALAGAGDFDGDGRRDVLVGSPFLDAAGVAMAGRVDRLTAPRFRIDRPASSTYWFAGGVQSVEWRGAEPAVVELTTDAGRTWQVVAAIAGGEESNRLDVRTPTALTDSARVRIRPASPGVPAEPILSNWVKIGRTTVVERFAYQLEDDGVRLEWATDPGIALDGWSGYRLARLAGGPDAEPQPIGPERIEEHSLVVPDFERGATYILSAVDGNGMVAELGRVSVPAAGPRFRVWPVPSSEFGDVELSLFPPVDGAGRTSPDFELRVYDMAGRSVRRLVQGARPTRVGELGLAWDRRDDRGAFVRPGVYFVRAESPSRAFRLDRRIVLLR